MKVKICKAITLLVLINLMSCGTSNERGTSLKDLDKVIAEDQSTLKPARSILTAGELIELSACSDLSCVQLYMKDKSSDFFYAQKGEFAALTHGAVMDTSGQQLSMPLSTLYVSIREDVQWRIAHTVHTKQLNDLLKQEFVVAQFEVIDSAYYAETESYFTHSISPQHPGIHLFRGTTLKPWYFRGLYQKVTWPCYVFEVYKE